MIISFGSQGSYKSELSSTNPGNKDICKNLFKKGLKNVWINEFGGIPSIYRQADAVIEQLKQSKQFAGKKIILTGLCSGGGIASFLALKHRLDAFCLNARPLGAGVQCELGQKALQDADRWITHFIVEGDIVSAPSYYTLPFSIFDRVLTAIGIRTPGRFGKRYLIPPPPKTHSQQGKKHDTWARRQETKHAWAGDIFMNLLGYDVKATPLSLKEEGKLEEIFQLAHP